MDTHSGKRENRSQKAEADNMYNHGGQPKLLTMTSTPPNDHLTSSADDKLAIKMD
jgi:hypothetical protein